VAKANGTPEVSGREGFDADDPTDVYEYWEQYNIGHDHEGGVWVKTWDENGDYTFEPIPEEVMQEGPEAIGEYLDGFMDYDEGMVIVIGEPNGE